LAIFLSFSHHCKKIDASNFSFFANIIATSTHGDTFTFFQISFPLPTPLAFF